jgi:Ion channel
MLTVLTLMLLFLLFVIGPMQAAGVMTAHRFGYFFGLVLVPAAFLYSRNLLAAGPIWLAIALVIATALLDVNRLSRIDLYLDSAAWLIAGLTLSVVVARAVFGPGRITYHRVVGAILLYLSIGLVFVALFGFVALSVPNAFTNLATLQGDFAIAGNLIYFSFATLTTTGYGDIAPLHPYARSLANVEAIIGQIYPATLLARLVTLEVTNM